MISPLARGAALALLLTSPVSAQTSTPIFTPQQAPLAREHVPRQGYVIQDPGRMPVYVNPLPGGSWYINDLNRGPRPPVGPQPAPSVDDDED